ncbi:MAG: alpha-glucan family phosphorylase, partial [Candidatus Methanomethyliaceae archaeon]
MSTVQISEYSPIAVKLPSRIAGLNRLAYNLWWSWHLEARELFKSLDRALWKATGHNPIKLLQQIEPHRLVAAAQNPAFLAKYDAVMQKFDNEISSPSTWLNTAHPEIVSRTIAYFSPEFAIHRSLPIYAGGLGILAGDYCKEASDLGLHLVGIGFMYPKGYFHQHLLSDGWQEEVFEELDFSEAPIVRVTTPDRSPLIVEVPLNDGIIRVAIWEVTLGRVKLYLMDTNIEQNPPPDREISSRLYISDGEMRLKQEIILGIGGVRTLRALGLSPSIWHANEGHTAFMMLERVR